MKARAKISKEKKQAGLEGLRGVDLFMVLRQHVYKSRGKFSKTKNTYGEIGK